MLAVRCVKCAISYMKGTHITECVECSDVV